ncbi:EAL domain-containing protein [Halomonas sp. Alg239-R46]|uniref:EAL domain-containing protein n=1 Tax=Halomonas sp. Alg239-R46 TaxID=2993445 RepID=UPI00248DF59C|nr:EAL domain-containing protein [Halomonas sp. Alg239-R46]
MAHCLTHEELYLRYQPIYSLVSREITCMEALLRWRHKELGEVLPAEFIPVAEETGRNITVSINISAKQLRDLTFPFKLNQLLEKHGVESSSIKLEITESLLILESDN